MIAREAAGTMEVVMAMRADTYCNVDGYWHRWTNAYYRSIATVLSDDVFDAAYSSVN